ncbi:MAG: D-alanyl-D-alanine carboxypeptidase DacC [Melioribacteraceae bacterium]|nr:MAG: D-alanyl-D-alanine carboxypeptidase DacC [Melioribacteraceae bacterium]
MRRLLILFCFIIFAIANLPAQNLTSSLNSTIDIDELENAQWSGYAINLSSGEVLFNKNENFGLAPASGLKVVTTSAALEILGADYKYKTEIAFSGKIDNSGTLEGDLILLGGGDPTLGSDRVEGSLNLDELYSIFIEKIKSAGIKKIKGNVIGYSGLLGTETIPDNWFWVDMGNYYGAYPSGLTINDNLYYLVFEPGEKVGDITTIARTEPPIPLLSFDNYVTTGKVGSGDNAYIYNAPIQNNAVVRGTIPAGVDEFKIKGSMPDPGLFAADYMVSSLKEKGIEVSGKGIVTSSRPEINKVIYTHVSPYIADIVYYINKISWNLYTEHLLRTIALEKGDAPTNSEGTKLIKDFLQKNNIDVSGVELYDGCGLSRSNMVTTKMMCELLGYMSKSKNYEVFNKSLAVVGDPDDIGYYSRMGLGTLLEKNARIKSGLIERVRSFTGYLNNKSGELIAFSFIANNYSGSRRAVDKLHTQIMLKLAETE